MKMKIGVISDTHENMPLIAKAVNFFNDNNVEAVLHAGDIISPITFKEFRQLKCRIYAVYGNNDGEKKMLAEKFSAIGGIYPGPYEGEYAGTRIIMMHEPVKLDELAESGRYGVIIYGHTHKPDTRYRNDVLILNPGECCGWLTGNSTIALLYLPERKAEIINLT